MITDTAAELNNKGCAIIDDVPTARSLAQARRYFEHAIAIAPEQIHARLNLGEVSMIRGDAVQALTWYSSALAIDPSSHGAHYGMARAYLLLGRDFNALRHLRLFVEIAQRSEYEDEFTENIAHAEHAIVTIRARIVL